MSDSYASAFEMEDLGRFRRHARTGLVMTLIGAAIVVSSIVYSGRALVRVQAERTTLKEQLIKADQDLENVRKSAQTAKAELDQIQREVKAVRSAFAYVQLGIRQFSVRDYAGAVRFYDQALVADPNNHVVHDLRGYSLLRSGDVQGALVSLRRAVSLAPDYVWGHYNLALAYGKAGQMDEAMQQIRILVQLDPTVIQMLKGDGQFRIFRNVREYQALIGRG